MTGGQAPACSQISPGETGICGRGGWLGLRTAEPLVYRVVAAEQIGGTIKIPRSKTSRGSNQYSGDKDQNTAEDYLEYGG